VVDGARSRHRSAIGWFVGDGENRDALAAAHESLHGPDRLFAAAQRYVRSQGTTGSSVEVAGRSALTRSGIAVGCYEQAIWQAARCPRPRARFRALSGNADGLGSPSALDHQPIASSLISCTRPGRSDTPASEGATLPPVDRRHHPAQAGRHKGSDRQSQGQSAEMQFG
jgi:hypothetical protein